MTDSDVPNAAIEENSFDGESDDLTALLGGRLKVFWIMLEFIKYPIYSNSMHGILLKHWSFPIFPNLI